MVPKPYTVPTDGPVGRMLEATGQHPWRPAHIHFKVETEGHEPLITQVFFPDDPYLDNDTIGAVKSALVRPLTRHESEEDLARRDLAAPFYTCEFDITLKPAMSAARA
jgi:protocatechuate 3,4-dioxygenase beta subunit